MGCERGSHQLAPASTSLPVPCSFEFQHAGGARRSGRRRAPAGPSAHTRSRNLAGGRVGGGATWAVPGAVRSWGCNPGDNYLSETVPREEGPLPRIQTRIALTFTRSF